jgi:ribosomal protein S1
VPTVEVGQVVKGRVQKVERFGVFLEVGPRTTGLLPTSEMEAERGANLVELFPIGREVEVQVMSIEDQSVPGKDGKPMTRKRIRLSQKALKGESEAADYREYKSRVQADTRRSVTLGDLFAAQLKR